MRKMDLIASWIRADDVEPALRLLAAYEETGKIRPRDAEEWRRRITGWARYREIDDGTTPSA